MPEPALPNELLKLIEANPQARQAFDKLPPSHKREHIAYIDEAKKTETRQRRARRTLEMLLEPAQSGQGYSGTPLVKKLGLKPGMRTLFRNQPQSYLETLGYSEQANDIPSGGYDFAQVFVTDRARLAEELPELKERLSKDGMIWVSWPKKSSKLPSDLTEDVIREIALAQGLVDVKVCAVDETWSGLKLVYRRKDR
ncbi:MAG TPA: DUF3052 family protein [Dehalococcoidia bacterium]|nr:DUF3052 family protein [Dehalococcoidia bacterium]